MVSGKPDPSSQRSSSSCVHAPFWKDDWWPEPVAQIINCALSCGGISFTPPASAALPSALPPIWYTFPLLHSCCSIQARVSKVSDPSVRQNANSPSLAPLPRMSCITAANPSGQKRRANSSVAKWPYGERSITAGKRPVGLRPGRYTTVDSSVPSRIGTLYSRGMPYSSVRR
jgi:hypothetical protein